MAFYSVNAPDRSSTYCLKIDQQNRTTALLGVIKVRATKGRENPPQPFNGFNTASTPFGNGHIMALSLGGSDDPRNIVPQWEQWQQTGQWRKVEDQCALQDGHIMRVDIDYQNAADNYAADKAKWWQNSFHTWTNPNLPAKFSVAVYDQTLCDVGKLTSESAFDGALNSLDKAKPRWGKQELEHSEMPDEDRQYWLDQLILEITKDLHDDFTTRSEMEIEEEGAVLDRTISFTDFILHPDTMEEVKDELSSVNAIDPTEINGLQTNRLFTAALDNPTPKKFAARKAQFKQTFGEGESLQKRKTAVKKRRKSAREQRMAAIRATPARTDTTRAKTDT